MNGYREFAAFYDRLTGDIDYAQEAEQVLRLLADYGCAEPETVLDLACGSGSLSVELAQRGVDVIGVDGSADMLAKANEKAAAAGKPLLFVQQDMRELDLYGTVDAAVCMLDSLSHLCRTADLREVFRRLHLFVAPGGLLIFDVNTPYKHREVLGDNAFVFEEDDFVCVWRNRLEERSGIVDMQLDFFVDSGGSYRRLTDTVRERAYSRRTWEKLLADAGFGIEAVYGADMLSPPGPQEERWVFVTRRL